MSESHGLHKTLDLDILHQCLKRVKSENEEVLGLIPTFLEVKEEKLASAPPPYLPPT